MADNMKSQIVRDQEHDAQILSGRRAFLLKSAALIAAMGSIPTSNALAGQQPPVEAGVMANQPALNQAIAPIDLRGLIHFAMKTGDINGALQQYGASLSPEMQKILGQLTKEDLGTWDSIGTKFATLNPSITLNDPSTGEVFQLTPCF